MAYSFNKRLFRQTITRQIGERFIDVAYNEALAQFDNEKTAVIEEVRNHPISMEIAEGPTSAGGVLDGDGNLFSFIGFSDSQKPIDELTSSLERNMSIRKRSLGARYGEDEISYSFPVYGPTQFDFESELPMPEWSGGSWVKKIETGIWGLGFYIYNAIGLKGSRSGTGLQAKNKLRETNYVPRSYLTVILKRFFSKYK